MRKALLLVGYIVPLLRPGTLTARDGYRQYGGPSFNPTEADQLMMKIRYPGKQSSQEQPI